MKPRICDLCQKPVPEDDICECFKKKIQLKREQLEKENKEDVKVNVFIVNSKDVLTFHVPEKDFNDFCNEESLQQIRKIFTGIEVAIIPKQIDISIVKNEKG